MLLSSPGLRPLRQTAGALGAVALIALGAVPAVADDGSSAAVTLGEIAPIDGVKPGSTFEPSVAFTNTGTAAADKVWLSYTVTRGLSHTELPSNCLRYEIPSYDEAPSKSEAVCEFDQTVKPGAVYAPEKALTLKALDRALYDRLRVVVGTTEPGLDENASEPVRGTGPAVKLAEQPDATPAAPGDGSHPDWDDADVKVTADNTADFKVAGAQLKGAVGDTVDLSVKFTNAGPAWVLRDSGVSATKVRIKMPAGTTVTRGHGFCEKVATGTYECGTSESWENEGEGETYTFKLKIAKAVPGAKGSVTLAGESRPFDRNKADDTADITLAASGSGGTTGGTTGGTGSTGGDGGGSTTSTGGTGTSTQGSTGGSTSTGGGSATGTSGSTTVDGNLASTGSGATLPIAGAAAAAVVVGTGAILVVRRRRTDRP
ncbi:hypothetical protein [Streptomyces sp. NBC_00078]|uniref:hypothetical protein n=1 Tax=unclassified Streptomyces TaxID=2593676 RepID=UPI0022502198|nr:hypothetical protein [Streptomyces sp. NBC_00078]MCX5425278.1 hypothetical protein [Streptomyces sp. NBC_00078]